MNTPTAPRLAGSVAAIAAELGVTVAEAARLVVSSLGGGNAPAPRVAPRRVVLA